MNRTPPSKPKQQQENDDLKTVKSIINTVLDILLAVSLFLHITRRTSLLFANPLSDRLKDEPTLAWLCGIFILWIIWKASQGRVSISRRSK
jgi:hypothetical protein